MSVINPLSLSERLHSALNQVSLVMKCQEISSLLQEVSSKDGGYILRIVVESIFGAVEENTQNVQSQQLQQLGGGWGLRIITLTDHQAEFQAMRAFLSPNGPLLNLIYRISHDPSQLIPFPVACLPVKVRTEIQEGNAGPFYTNRIQNLGPGKTPTNILFNAFEFYFFHFGYFLVGSSAQQWNLFWTSVKDALYLTLLEDYLSAFLSCDATLPPGPPSAPLSPRSTFSPLSQRSFEHTQLVDMGTVGSMHFIPHQSLSPLHPAMSQNSEANTWTSQTLIEVLMEIWINLCVSPPMVSSAHHSSPSFTSMQPSMSYSPPTMKDVFVPVADHVRAVRMVVKHFHYFTNSQKPHYPSPLEPLRRNIWAMCRKSLYHFFEHLFIHWPLDSSFRIVLETWLSYIQPWRYVLYTPLERNRGLSNTQEGEVLRCVEPKWKGFIAENLLFYSHLFCLFLKRVLRLDLASPKNAQILFRVAKVLSQENLLPMVQEVEDLLLEANQMQKSSLGIVGGVASPCVIPSVQDPADGQHLPQVITQMVRSHILEVEKPHYIYTSMFGEEVLASVGKLVRILKRDCNALSSELNENQGATSSPTRKESSGWFGYFVKAVFDSPPTREDETSMEEMKKCLSHLEFSMNLFCILFNVTVPEKISGMNMSASSNQRSHSDSVLGTPEKTRIPDQTLTEKGPTLTDFGRYQLLNGLKRMDLKYEGDPDLSPICSYEIGFLVRFFYFLSSFINKKYESEFTSCYYRRDFLGSLSRVFLRGPETIYEYRSGHDTDGLQTKTYRDLPPRLSFRAVAHKRVIFFFITLYVFLWMCGYTVAEVTFQLVIPFFVTYVLCKGALHRKCQVTV